MDGGFTDAVSMPTCPPVDDDCISYAENVAYKDGMLDCSRELKLKVVEFSPKQYLTLKQTLKSMEYDERKVPVLAVSESAAAEPEEKAIPPASPVESDARILESHKELALTDAHSAVYRVRYSEANPELCRQDQGGRGEDRLQSSPARRPNSSVARSFPKPASARKLPPTK